MNSILNTRCFCSRWSSAQRPVSGSIKANHAFKFQANDTISMYAPLLSKVFVRAANARQSPCSWANRFSWLQQLLS